MIINKGLHFHHHHQQKTNHEFLDITMHYSSLSINNSFINMQNV